MPVINHGGLDMVRLLIFSSLLLGLLLVAGGCSRNRHTVIRFEAEAGAFERAPFHTADSNVRVAYYIEVAAEEKNETE
mgnify:FL=1